KSQNYWPWTLKKIKSLKMEGDKRTNLCHTCNSRASIRAARQKLLAGYGLDRGSSKDDQHEVLVEVMAHAVKKGGGYKVVLTKAQEVHRERGLTEEGRRRFAIGRLVSAKRTGEFRLCPLCH